MGNHKDAGWRFPKGATKGACGEVSHIRFINIYSVSENGVFVGGDVPGKVNDISFINVNLTLRQTTPYPGGVYDLRPRDGEGFIQSPAYGFLIDCADNVSIRDCSVELDGFPESRFGGFRKNL